MSHQPPTPIPGASGRAGAVQIVSTSGGARGAVAFAALANLGYAVALATVSLMADPPLARVFGRSDWLAHGFAYGLQTLVLCELFRRLFPPVPAIAASAACAFGFGTVVESLQVLQPARTFEVRDLAANAVGAAITCVLLLSAGWIRTRTSPGRTL